jgi:hypothetical protein
MRVLFLLKFLLLLLESLSESFDLVEILFFLGRQFDQMSGTRFLLDRLDDDFFLSDCSSQGEHLGREGREIRGRGRRREARDGVIERVKSRLT